MQITQQKSWDDARLQCYNKGGQLAVFENTMRPHSITEFFDKYMMEWETFYVGGRAANTGQWITVTNKLFDSHSSLWGPGEPSGDGLCGDLLLVESWNPKWRINDDNCLQSVGFVCEKQKTDAGKDSGEHFKCAVLYLASSQNKVKPQVHRVLLPDECCLKKD